MKLFVQGDATVLDGIRALSEDLSLTLTDEAEAELKLSVEAVSEEILSVNYANSVGKITYGTGKARFFRGLGLLIAAAKENRTLEITEHPLFTLNGTMMDMSRNAVMNLPTVKFTLRKMALMGLNAFMLYTEDTYEVADAPYFGHLRGRYSVAEIREMDAYAQSLGIELIPCIQTLGHLATYLKWPEATPCKDSANTLLVGSPETDRLIENMLRSVASAFSSRRLHIGMDETHDLGTGRSLDLNGYRTRTELYLAHLNRVAEMAQRFGFRPMMWSDMFFRLSSGNLPGYIDFDMRTELLPEIPKLIPKGVQQIFWDYYNDNEAFYAVNLDKFDALGENTLFAGGIWAWSGHAVQFSRSIRNSVPALEACRKKGTREVVATVWHNGSECSLLMSLAGLQMYAEYDYHNHYNEEEIRAGFRISCNAEYDDFLKTEAVEYPHGDNTVTGASRALLYNDPMLGIADAHVAQIDAGAYYRAITPTLKPLAEGKGEFAPGFAIIYALSDLLCNKSDFGVRLKKAYDARDTDALKALQAECTVMREKLAVLRQTHRASWMRWNKPFGWEVHDIRYGGLDARLETCAERIGAYLSGEADALEELEAPRLRLDGLNADAPAFSVDFLWKGYQTYATVNNL